MARTINKNTLADQVYDILKEDILSQRIEPGAQITHKMVQDRFEVSSTPARQALLKLAEDNLVEYISNIGTRVIKLSQKDIYDLFEFASDIDAIAVRYAGKTIEQFNTCSKELERNIAESNKALTCGDYRKWSELSDHFHVIFYNNSNNTRLIDASRKLYSQINICSTSYESKESVIKEIQKDHIEIARLFSAKNYEKASSLMRSHVLKSMQYTLDSIPAKIIY